MTPESDPSCGHESFASVCCTGRNGIASAARIPTRPPTVASRRARANPECGRGVPLRSRLPVGGARRRSGHGIGFGHDSRAYPDPGRDPPPAPPGSARNPKRGRRERPICYRSDTRCSCDCCYVGTASNVWHHRPRTPTGGPMPPPSLRRRLALTLPVSLTATCVLVLGGTGTAHAACPPGSARAAPECPAPAVPCPAVPNPA